MEKCALTRAWISHQHVLPRVPTHFCVAAWKRSSVGCSVATEQPTPLGIYRCVTVHPWFMVPRKWQKWQKSYLLSLLSYLYSLLFTLLSWFKFRKRCRRHQTLVLRGVEATINYENVICDSICEIREICETNKGACAGKNLTQRLKSVMSHRYHRSHRFIHRYYCLSPTF